MVAAWDRRDAGERARVEALVLARWLPAAVTAAPFHAARTGGELDDRTLADRTGLRQLIPHRERDVLAAAGGGASLVLRPTEGQIKATADDAVIRRIARAIGRDGREGQRDAIVEEYRPLTLHRGGVSGELLIASSRSDLDRLHRTGARAAAVLGLGDEDVVTSLVPTGPSLAHLAVTHLAAGAGLTAWHPRGAGVDLATAARAVAEVPTTVVVVTLDDAGELPAALRAGRVRLGGVHTVVTVGPPPDDEVRGALQDAFETVGADVRIRALWGPAAGRTLWAECGPGSGLHTYPDLEVLEVLDPLAGTPTDGDGDLTVTSAGWNGSALVRFQTGAWVEPLATEPCPRCERTVPRIVGDVVEHAWELAVDLGQGAPGSVDLRGVAVVAATTPGVSAWRAELRSATATVPRDRLVVEFAGGGRDVDAVRERLTAATGLEPELRTGLEEVEVAAAVDRVGGILADLR